MQSEVKIYPIYNSRNYLSPLDVSSWMVLRLIYNSRNYLSPLDRDVLDLRLLIYNSRNYLSPLDFKKVYPDAT